MTIYEAAITTKSHDTALEVGPQDTMQAAGFYNLSEEDASGEDRPLILDRGWTVVSQSPKPGTRASLDRTIILRAKKDYE